MSGWSGPCGEALLTPPRGGQGLSIKTFEGRSFAEVLPGQERSPGLGRRAGPSEPRSAVAHPVPTAHLRVRGRGACASCVSLHAPCASGHVYSCRWLLFRSLICGVGFPFVSGAKFGSWDSHASIQGIGVLEQTVTHFSAQAMPFLYASHWGDQKIEPRTFGRRCS